VGRALAEAAVARGWEVTCFNRGRTGRDVPGVETVRGDRTVAGDVARLAGSGRWDAVVDTGAYEPPEVAAVAGALVPVVGRYVVVSSVSAYRDWPAVPTTEESPVWRAQPEARRRDLDAAGVPGPVAYGTLKAGCEVVVRQLFEDRALVVRPGVVLGPYEYVGRLDAMLGRAARGGPLLVAGTPNRSIQPVDVRDLVVFVSDLIENRAGGTFNVVAPPGHASYGELIEACIVATGSEAVPVWVDPGWLVERGVAEWTQLTLWASPPGTWAVDGSRAQHAGLGCRPIGQTVAETWAWLRKERPVAHARAAEHGLSPEREAALLAEWTKR
jgi:2'-hydroxyisoflavone reductase